MQDFFYDLQDIQHVKGEINEKKFQRVHVAGDIKWSSF